MLAEAALRLLIGTMGKHGKGGKEIVAAGVDNTSRRKWDGAEFAQKAAEREEKVFHSRLSLPLYERHLRSPCPPPPPSPRSIHSPRCLSVRASASQLVHMFTGARSGGERVRCKEEATAGCVAVQQASRQPNGALIQCAQA